MNKIEAQILTLEVFAENTDLLIEMDKISDAIKTPKDSELINTAFEELAVSLKKKADKLKAKRLICPG